MTDAKQFWLSLDLSAPVGSYALHERHGGKLRLVREMVTEATGNHTETAISKISELLIDAGLKLENVDRFLTPIGPGSFTGLRLSLSTFKAFAFAVQKPITTLNASEARWLAHGSKEPGVVLTFSTSEKVIVTRFDKTGRQGFETAERYDELGKEAPNVILSDGRLSAEKLPDTWIKNLKEFPLRARHLAETADRAASRRDYTTPAEWIALSPEYLGTSIKPNKP